MRPAAAAAAVAAASALCACLNIKPYKGPIEVNYIPEDSGGATAATPDNITLHFPGGSGFHFPDQLTIDNVDVMGHVAAPCWGESGTGFAVMPMPRVSGDPLDGGVPPTSELRAQMTGPAVVQFKVTWSTHWSFAAGSTCSTNAKHTPSGSSTFTVFPDNRIVRHDVMTDDNPDGEHVMTDQCTCADMPKSRDAFIQSSYWAFARARFPMQFGLGTAGPGIPDPLTLGVDYFPSSPYETVCFDGPADQYQIASVWKLPPRIMGEPPKLTAIAVGFDTVVSHDIQKPATPTPDFLSDVHGALFIERSNCTAALKRAIDYTEPRELTIDTGSGTISKLPSELDGIYGGDPGAGGSPGIDVSSGATKLGGGPLTGSFVVWLRFPPGSVIVPTASRPGAVTGWYVPQRINDREWLIWVQDALQPNETITVQPNY